MKRFDKIENFRRVIKNFAYRLIALTVTIGIVAYIGQSLSTSETVFASAEQTVTRMALITQEISARFEESIKKSSVIELKPTLIELNESCRKLEELHSRMMKGDPGLRSIDSFRERLQNIYYADSHRSGSHVRCFLENYRQLATLIQDSAKVDHRKLTTIEKVMLPKLMNSFSLAAGQFETARADHRLILISLLLLVVLLVFSIHKWLEKRRKKPVKMKRTPLTVTKGVAQAIEYFDPMLGAANRGLFALASPENMPDSKLDLYSHDQHIPAGTKDIVTIHLDDAVEVRINVRKFCASLKEEDDNQVRRTRKIKLARLLERALDVENPELTEYRMIIRRLGDLFLRDSQAIQARPRLKQKVEL